MKHLPADVETIILDLTPKSIALLHVLLSMGFFTNGSLKFNYAILSRQYPQIESPKSWRSALIELEEKNIVQVEFDPSTRLTEVRRPYEKDRLFHATADILGDTARAQYYYRKHGPSELRSRIKYIQYRAYIKGDVDNLIGYAIAVLEETIFTSPRYLKNFDGIGLGPVVDGSKTDPVQDKISILDPETLQNEAIALWDTFRGSPAPPKESGAYINPYVDYLIKKTGWKGETVKTMVCKWYGAWAQTANAPKILTETGQERTLDNEG